MQGKETDLRIKQLESDITYLIAKQEAELALSVNSAAYHGDLYHLKGLINAGADPSKTDYDGRTALVHPPNFFLHINSQSNRNVGEPFYFLQYMTVHCSFIF